MRARHLESKTRVGAVGPTVVSLAVLAMVPILYSGIALAHGERAQEPFIRMSTIQWYDAKWSSDRIKVNEEVTLTGRFHVAKNWSPNLPAPDLTFLNVGIPGPVMIRVASSIDGVNGVSSMPLELDRDYEYKLVLRGRLPGRYHVHPMMDIHDAGPTLGPGSWVTVEGDAASFTDPVSTLTGQTLDLVSYGLGRVVRWHLLWVALAAFWLLYWLRKPLLVPRYEALQHGEGDKLVTPTDRLAGAALLAVTLVLVIAGFAMGNAAYPITIPLQSNQTIVPPLPEQPKTISIESEHVTYNVPGRTVQFRLRVTNHGDKPVRIGEFTAANLRFLDQNVEKPGPDYPPDLIAPSGLVVHPDEPIAPGETKQMHILATSAAWETDRLAMLINDPTNRIGGLFMFFDPEGKRSIVEFSSPIIPTFARFASGQ